MVGVWVAELRSAAAIWIAVQLGCEACRRAAAPATSGAEALTATAAGIWPF